MPNSSKKREDACISQTIKIKRKIYKLFVETERKWRSKYGNIEC